MPTEDRCKQIRHATATHLSALLGVLARAQTAAFLLAALFVLCAAAPQAWAAAATTTTTLAVTSAGSPVTTVASKTVVALTATVTAGSTAVKPGQVNFCDATAKLCTDIHLLGTAQLTSAGTASMKFRPGIGSHSYKAVFAGTKSNAASTSSASALEVTATVQYPTTTTIAQSGSNGNYTLAATVAGLVNAPGLASPTGAVSFLDTSNGNAVLGTASLVPATAGVSWLNSQSLSTGNSPESIAVADLNGDGILDLAVADFDEHVTILLGNGDGTFVYKLTVGAGAGADAVAVADFNGDGIPDLAFTNAADSTVSIVLGNGDGTFTAKSSSATGHWPNAIAVGDFNGDGFLDLAIANAPYGFVNGFVTILLGNGDGTFTAAASPPVPGAPWDVVAGDFNGDGIPDLALAGNNNAVAILLGNGDGTFTAAAASPPTGSGTGYAFVADFDGDGKADLAVTNSDNTLTILLGNGDGTFRATAASPMTFPYTASVGPSADFNGDGIPDLFVVDYSNHTVRYLLGNGDGTFTATAASPQLDSNLQELSAGDFNGDGIPDLAVNQYPVVGDTVAIWLTQLTRTATAPPTGISLPAGTGTHLVQASYPGDINFLDSISAQIGLATGGTQSQTITFANPGTQTYGTPLTLSATASSGLPVTYEVLSGSATLSGSVLTFTSTGSVTVQASQTGNSDYAAATPVSQTFQVSPEAQTITFANPGTQTYGTSLTLNATASSGLAVSFASTTTSVCTVSGNTAAFLIAGTCTIQATQPGNSNYLAATPVSRSFAVNHGAQTITFPNPGTQTYGTPFTLIATASSELAVSFTSTTTSVCTVSGNTATFVIAGTCTIQATQPGNSTYAAATPVSQSFTVNHEAQTITFPAIPTTTLVTGTVTLNAAASSGLPVSYASTNTSVCTVSGSAITLLNFGTCGIWATQAGSGGFSSAPEAGQAFAVTIAGQTITFPNPGTQTYGEAPFTLSATASSNLPVSYASTTSSICTVSGSTVTLLAVGTCGIVATQAGNNDYAAAAAVGLVFPVVKNQIITFPAIPTTTLVTGTITLNATASSHLPVSYASTNTSVCTVSGSTVTLLNFGTCGIWATQAGNGSIPPAPQVGHAFQVTLATQTITFARPDTQTYGEAPFTLSATASSNLPVSYASTTPLVCTVSGSTVTLLAAGNCGIVATQSGNTHYAAAPEVGHTFLVAKEAQTITFLNPGTQTAGAVVTLNATASSGLPVGYASTTPSVCTVSGSSASMVADGYCGIVGTQAGSAYYAPAPEVGHMFLVSGQN